MSTKIIKDKFKRNRGGYSRLLNISCSKCKTGVCHYQKDGPGILKRMYLDRISESKFEPSKQLVCPKCKQVLGIKYVYEKEKRPAYRLFVGAISKLIIKI